MLKQETIKKWADDQAEWFSIQNEITPRDRNLIQACYQNASIKGWQELNQDKDAVWLMRRAVLDDAERKGGHGDYERARAARTLSDLLTIWRNLGD